MNDKMGSSRDMFFLSNVKDEHSIKSTKVKKCRFKKCTSILSMYNNNIFCFCHSVQGNEDIYKQKEKKNRDRSITNSRARYKKSRVEKLSCFEKVQCKMCTNEFINENGHKGKKYCGECIKVRTKEIQRRFREREKRSKIIE